MSTEQDISDARRRLSDTCDSLHRVSEPLQDEDRQQVLKILRLVTQIAGDGVLWELWRLQVYLIPGSLQAILNQWCRMSNRKRLCVLVVAKHLETCTVIARLLDQHNYEVRTASTWQQAETHASTGECCVLIADSNLDDPAEIAEMRTFNVRHKIRAVTLCWSSDRRDTRQLLNAGFERVIPKPMTMELLIQAVEDLCSG